MKIIIGGDLGPMRSNRDDFINARTEKLIDDKLKTILDSSDFRIFNLETPLADKEEAIEKNGPNFIAPTEAINGIKALNVDFLTLANNHILDQGEQGLISTIDVLKKAGIAFAGAGENITEARKPYIYEKGSTRIGIYCCAEHEFSIATEHSAGANPFDVLESFEHIEILRQECDYLIVLYHGGKEYYRYPSPYLQKVCRKMIEHGADLVVCQHSHCVGCKEEWNNGTIVYGQGNFLYDTRTDNECYKTELLLELNIEKPLKAELCYIPLIKQNNSLISYDSDEHTVLDDFYKRSSEIVSDGFVEKKYTEFAQEKLYDYLESFHGTGDNSVLFRLANRISRGNTYKKSLKKAYDRRRKVILRNYIQCEAHRELILRALEKGE